ncbi:MAG: hypothetical protein JNL97_12155 [Verrucomicrobiales bacterium]|nr:hypothetical protein [Verrucomicrobiales bacterium]
MPATLDYGGPTFDHAALGAQLEVVVEELEGPSGGRFGFWESVEDEEGPSATFEVPSGLRGGTNRFLLSQTGGAEGVDPYGHVHGRVFTATEPGLYAVGLRLREVSSNGPGGGPLHRESEVFRLQFQAGITIARIVPDGDDVRVVFATAVGYAYRVETSETLGPGAAWLPVGEVVRGDDRLREVRLPKGKATGFFRLRREVS